MQLSVTCHCVVVIVLGCDDVPCIVFLRVMCSSVNVTVPCVLCHAVAGRVAGLVLVGLTLAVMAASLLSVFSVIAVLAGVSIVSSVALLVSSTVTQASIPGTSELPYAVPGT